MLHKIAEIGVEVVERAFGRIKPGRVRRRVRRWPWGLLRADAGVVREVAAFGSAAGGEGFAQVFSHAPRLCRVPWCKRSTVLHNGGAVGGDVTFIIRDAVVALLCKESMS